MDYSTEEGACRRYRTNIALAGFGFFLWAAVPAHADWQYTKWGMSPEQVVAASHGSAMITTPSPKDTKSPERLAVMASGIYVIEKFEFLSSFYFEKKERKLERIQLTYDFAKGRPPISELLQALQEKYGPWSPDTVWIVGAENYSLKFDPVSGGLIAFLIYEPLHRDERKGL
jgi:hypothetical protein